MGVIVVVIFSTHSSVRLLGLRIPLKSHYRFSNCERLKSYDFELPRSRSRGGVSALVRVKNESQKIRHCLLSILPIFDEIVLVDNASSDDTVKIVMEIKERHDRNGKIQLFSYPFQLARFGPEHDNTPENSVYSAVYYSNWALSHCSRRFVCKWDGDMLLKRACRQQFRGFLNRVQDHRNACWMLTGQTVYRDLSGEFYLAMGDVNQDVEVLPNEYACRFVKRKHWEAIQWPRRYRLKKFDPVCFYELKFVDEDEFSHWSTREWPSERKRREWENYWLVKEGEIPEGEFEKLPATFLDEEVELHECDPPLDWQKVALRTLPWFVCREIRLWAERSPWLFRRASRSTDTFLIGHPKSGNTWLAYMLAVMLFRDFDARVNLANVGEYVPFVHGEDWRITDYRLLPSPRVFRNEFPRHPNLYHKVIYLFRDPRAVLVSFWHMYRVMFDDNQMSLDSFVEQYLADSGCFVEWNAGLQRWDRQVSYWFERAESNDQILLVKYEDLVEDRRSQLCRLYDFLEITENEAVELAIERGDLQAMKALEQAHGAEAYKGRAKGNGEFIRVGAPDGWKAEMGDTLAETIQTEFSDVMHLGF